MRVLDKRSQTIQRCVPLNCRQQKGESRFGFEIPVLSFMSHVLNLQLLLSHGFKLIIYSLQGITSAAMLNNKITRTMKCILYGQTIEIETK